MCIDGRKPGHYRCCCAFDTKFFVIWTASIESFLLFEAIKYKAYAQMVGSIILLSLFLAAFFIKKNPLIR